MWVAGQWWLIPLILAEAGGSFEFKDSLVCEGFLSLKGKEKKKEKKEKKRKMWVYIILSIFSKKLNVEGKIDRS